MGSTGTRIAALLLAVCLSPSMARGDFVEVFSDGFEDGTQNAWLNLVSGSGTLETTDGATHTYYFHVPATASPAAGRPVLIWLHGDGGSGNGYGTAFYPFTDPDGGIVVTPSGTNQTWTHAASDLVGQPQDSQFLSLLIDMLIASGVGGSTVDPARIYLGGESRGAYMPYFLLQRASTRERLAAVAVNAGLLYCQAGDTECDAGGSNPTLHAAATPILHLHGTNDPAVEPPPTATFHVPVDWGIDWRVFWPMKFWAEQHGCFDGNPGGNNNGVLQETFPVGGNSANRYDLSAWGASCSRYQLILVTNGGHVIAGQHERIWSFLRSWQLGD
ncbi:MAG: hypothetical protein ABI689_14420 [Thermoanaerobaculia bacterium]